MKKKGLLKKKLMSLFAENYRMDLLLTSFIFDNFQFSKQILFEKLVMTKFYISNRKFRNNMQIMGEN